MIIPNEMSFNADLKDLPIRANKVSKDMLRLTRGKLSCGGSGRRWKRSSISVAGAKRRKLWKIANSSCPGICFNLT